MGFGCVDFEISGFQNWKCLKIDDFLNKFLKENPWKSTIFKEDFQIFQFWKREISKSTQPNPTKFQERVKHVPKYLENVFLGREMHFSGLHLKSKKMIPKCYKIIDFQADLSKS